MGAAGGNSIRIKPTQRLLDYIETNIQHLNEAPEGLRKLSVQNKVRQRKHNVQEAEDTDSGSILVSDVQWLRKHIQWLQYQGKSAEWLHELLEGSTVILPGPPAYERNPELEARIQRLKREQAERDYKAMTKNVDTVRHREPDETIASQIKMINRQLIAVFQFIISVAAGFLFGFKGIEMMRGEELDFGFRLLLGVAIALIIALADMYFLAKKLSEADNEDLFPTMKIELPQPARETSRHIHAD